MVFRGQDQGGKKQHNYYGITQGGPSGLRLMILWTQHPELGLEVQEDALLNGEISNSLTPNETNAESSA